MLSPVRISDDGDDVAAATRQRLAGRLLRHGRSPAQAMASPVLPDLMTLRLDSSEGMVCGV